MSSLIIRCVPLKNVRPHPNADNLVLADLMGWQVVLPKAEEPKDEDLKVFIPPDSILTNELAEELGVTKYLRSGNRVKAVRLRGEMSFGLSVDNKWNFEIGEEVSAKLNIVKWEPPEEVIGGDQEKSHPLFHTYTDIENIKNFPGVFKEGEDIWVSEKIHGTNGRSGIIKGEELPMIGTHRTRKKLGQNSVYEKPLPTLLPLLAKLKQDYPDYQNILVFYEIFGAKIQDLNYGILKAEDVSFRVFDIAINQLYLGFYDLEKYCKESNVPMVPVIYRGPYNKEVIEKLAGGPTGLMKENPHMREGIVIKPITEQRDPKLGRKVLKCISNEYYLRKKGTEKH